MRFELDPDVKLDDRARRRLHAELDRLRRRLARYDLDPELKSSLSRLEDGRHQLRLELCLPREVLTASVAEQTEHKAIAAAFAGLRRRFDQYAFDVDPARWRPIGHRRQAATEDEVVRAYREDLLRYALPVLRRIAGHDLSIAWAEDLLPDEPVEPDDLVDEVIAENLDELRGQLPVAEATLWLVERLRDRLHQKLDQLADKETEQAWDAVVPPPWPPDDRIDTWAFADVVELQDVIGDATGVDPEGVLDERRLRDRLVRLLFTLPDRERALFSQVIVDDWSPGTVAAAWRASRDEVVEAVHRATTLLLERLGEEDVAEQQLIGLYRSLGERLREERKAREPLELA